MQWLARHTPATIVVDPWNGPEGVVATAYLDSAPLPDDCAMAARAIVFKASQTGADPDVLVLDTEYGPLLMPGGRCEPGETLEQTLRREILEEAGWTVAGVRPIGFVHVRRLGPWREGQPYPLQEFQFAIFAAEADQPRPDAILAIDTEEFLSIAFRPLAEVQTLPLTWPPRLHQRLFLEAAVRTRRDASAPPVLHSREHQYEAPGGR